VEPIDQNCVITLKKPRDIHTLQRSGELRHEHPGRQGGREDINKKSIQGKDREGDRDNEK
jgi:hypothetical protein